MKNRKTKKKIPRNSRLSKEFYPPSLDDVKEIPFSDPITAPILNRIHLSTLHFVFFFLFAHPCRYHA